jgi:hypothetical protein
MQATATPQVRPSFSKRQQYDRTASALKQERTSFESHWREIAEYLFPMRPRFTITDRNRGDRRNQKIIDSTATFAANTLSSGLHAGLTSPARPWMKLSTPDPELAKFPPVAKWLYDVTQRMLTVFQLSNLYKVLPSIYDDMGVFGTAAVGILDDPSDVGRSGDLFRCYQYPIGSYWIDRDNRGLPSTFFREYSKTVEQLIEEFGGPDGQKLELGHDPDWSRFSLTVKRLWDEHQSHQQIEICWMVTANRDYREGALGYRGFPWVSCHFEKAVNEPTHSRVLREAGFHEFPVLVPTWKRGAEDLYGTDCPGMTALGDVRQLQAAQKIKGQAIAKLVHPPLQAPHSVRTQKVSALPSDISYVDVGAGQEGIRPLYEIRPDVQHLVLDINDVRGLIHKAFHVDLFRMIQLSDQQGSSQPVTAEEIRAREQEKMIQLGPVLESTNDELLDPFIDRSYEMMLRAGIFDDLPAPPDLNGVELVPEYISILAQAQKLTKVAPLDGFNMRIANMAAVHPSVLHKIDPFELVNEYADAFGINPKLIKSDEDAAAGVEASARAAQEQAMAEQVAKLGAGAKALGSTPMEGDTALTRLAAGVA